MTFDQWFASYAPTAPEVLDDCARAAWDAGRDKLQGEFAAYKAGSEEAFGVVVDQKKGLEGQVRRFQDTVNAQQGVICDFREKNVAIRAQRDSLVLAMRHVEAGAMDISVERSAIKSLASIAIDSVKTIPQNTEKCRIDCGECPRTEGCEGKCMKGGAA